MTQIHKKYFGCFPKLFMDLLDENACGCVHALGSATSSIRSIVKEAEKVETQPLNYLLKELQCWKDQETWSAWLPAEKLVID